jgi:hypothetical protein
MGSSMGSSQEYMNKNKIDDVFPYFVRIQNLYEQSTNQHYTEEELPNRLARNAALSVVATLYDFGVVPSTIEICCDGGISIDFKIPTKEVIGIDILNTGDLVYTSELLNGDILSGESTFDGLIPFIENVVKDPDYGMTLRLTTEEFERQSMLDLGGNV